jgi:hypothetical protein
MSRGRPTLMWNGRPPGSTIGISAGQTYRTSNPVTARPMIIRWISDVPSKIVKILAIGAVYAGQRPAGPRGISTDSVRPVRDEFRFWAGPVRDWCAGGRRGDALGGVLSAGRTARFQRLSQTWVALPACVPAGNPVQPGYRGCGCRLPGLSAAGVAALCHLGEDDRVLSCDQAEVATFGAGRPWPRAPLPRTGYAVRRATPHPLAGPTRRLSSP